MDTARAEKDMDFYKLDRSERREVEEILDSMTRDGKLFLTDAQGRVVRDGNQDPVLAHYRILRSQRFLVCRRGRVWRYKAAGSPKDPRSPNEQVRVRYDGVEMWRGTWRPCIGPDGLPTFAKRTAFISVEAGTEVPEGHSPMEHYEIARGYKHPLDPPDAPTPTQMQAMSDKLLQVEGVVLAKAAEEGMTPEEAKALVDADEGIQAAKEAAKRRPKRAYKKPKKSVRRTPADRPAASEPLRGPPEPAEVGPDAAGT